MAMDPKTLEALVFYLAAGVMVGSSLMIVFTRNVVHSATWLLGTLGAAALLYFLLAANFLGAVQLIVYAGGILILIVFGVMLTARSPFLRFEPKPGERAMAAIVGVVLFAGLAWVGLRWSWPAIPAARGPVEMGKAAAMRDVGNALLTDYLVPFEVTSVLLLAVMLGAAYLARPERK